MLQQLSFAIFKRVCTRGDFSAIPLLARPPYLASLRHNDCPPDFLFRNKSTDEVGILMNPAKGLYYLVPPTLLSRDQTQDNPVKQVLVIEGWQAVCKRLELVGYDGIVITLTGSDDEPLLPTL